jgi:hypothetical protein
MEKLHSNQSAPNPSMQIAAPIDGTIDGAPIDAHLAAVVSHNAAPWWI